MSSLRECAVRMLPVPQPSGTVGRRPDHGVPEDDPAVERDQSGLDGRERAATGDPQLPGRPPDQCRIAGGIGRRDEQELAGLGGKLAELSQQGVGCPVRQHARQHVRQPEAAGQLSGRHALQQPEQGPGMPRVSATI